MQHKSKLADISHFLWHLFLGGLFAILPLALTIYIINSAFCLAVNLLSPLAPFIPEFLRIIPYVEFLFVILAIIMLGILMRIIVLRALIHEIEDLIYKIPLIRPVYSGIKQLVAAFDQQNKMSFKKVVLLEFPRKGLYSIGFLTSEEPVITPDDNRKYYNLFIPTTPNPTTGYFIILPEEDIKIINITRQDAMALIISGGIIQPEKMNFE